MNTLKVSSNLPTNKIKKWKLKGNNLVLLKNKISTKKTIPSFHWLLG